MIPIFVNCPHAYLAGYELSPCLSFGLNFIPIFILGGNRRGTNYLHVFNYHYIYPGV